MHPLQLLLRALRTNDIQIRLISSKVFEKRPTEDWLRETRFSVKKTTFVVFYVQRFYVLYLQYMYNKKNIRSQIIAKVDLSRPFENPTIRDGCCKGRMHVIALSSGEKFL